MNTVLQDVRYALRNLRKTPVFTAVALLSLALGIGANTAIFSLMDQVLLRALPVANPGELVLFNAGGPHHGRTTGPDTFSYPMYRDLRDRNAVFSGVLAYMDFAASIAKGGRTERARGELVSGDYFEVLGVRAALGRTLTSGDDRKPGAHPLVVLSNEYWRRRFGADRAILNQTIEVNDRALTVIGVLAPGFNGVSVGRPVDLFVPMMMKAQMTPGWDDLENRRSLWLNVMGRLKPGVSRPQAEAAMNTLWRPILEMELREIKDVPPGKFAERFVQKHLTLTDGGKGRSEFRDAFSAPLLVLMGMVGLVLLIACANVANLLIARAASRQKEIAIRLALGAGRRRIVSQLLVESLMLALIGGGLGLLVALWTGGSLIAFLPFEGSLRALSASPDARVLCFNIALSIVTGVLFGLIPALQSTRPNVSGTLKDQAANVSASAAGVGFRKALVVAQVALSLLLLIGAGLFARSLYNLKSLYPGFESAHLTTFAVDPLLNGYSQTRVKALLEQMQQKLQALPGVQSVAMSELGVLKGNDMMRTVYVEGYRAKEGEDLNPNVDYVSPQFFSTMKIPLLAGRDFSNADRAGGPQVAIISEKMAQYFFGHENPIGRRFAFGDHKDKPDIEIVGVVEDSRGNGLRSEAPRFVYLPYPQDVNVDEITFFVRTALDPARSSAALRKVVSELDPNLPIFAMKTMEAQVDEALFTDRIVAALSSFFGLLATLLAAIGLYGVMAYTVARRTREIGVRMALGAGQGGVLWMIMREVSVLSAIGVMIALPAAFALSRLIQSQLYGLVANDPLVIGVATLSLAAVALLAGYVPALRATRIDPIVALRYE
jgi:predicted permease